MMGNKNESSRNSLLVMYTENIDICYHKFYTEEKSTKDYFLNMLGIQEE